jgi:hypothetical protein
MFAQLFSHSTGMPTIDARADFTRARRAARVARCLSGRWRRPGHPRMLADGVVRTTRAARVESIALDAIVGTVELSRHFDERFRPTSERARARWERIALAVRRGIALPPIAVVHGSDGYYVTDGRHRVSVARAIGQREIDAWVR